MVPRLNLNMDASKVMLPLRGVQCALTLVVLGMTAYVSNWWMNYWRDMAPAEITFLIFSSVITMPLLAYVVLAQTKFPRIGHKLVLLGCDGIATTVWFAGFVALAVFLSSRICFGNVCNVAKASVAFAAFEWLLFAVTTVLQAFAAFKSRGVTPDNIKMVEDPPMMTTANANGESFEPVKMS